jgi:hypothetical protein
VKADVVLDGNVLARTTERKTLDRSYNRGAKNEPR